MFPMNMLVMLSSLKANPSLWTSVLQRKLMMSDQFKPRRAMKTVLIPHLYLTKLWLQLKKMS
jgi:hypothetical protein